MTRILTIEAFNRVVGLVLLTLMVLALAANPSAASRSQDVSPPATGADPAGPRPAIEFRHEGE